VGYLLGQLVEKPRAWCARGFCGWAVSGHAQDFGIQPSEQCATRGIVYLFMLLFSFPIGSSLEWGFSTMGFGRRDCVAVSTDDLPGSFFEPLFGVVHIFDGFSELFELS